MANIHVCVAWKESCTCPKASGARTTLKRTVTILLKSQCSPKQRLCFRVCLVSQGEYGLCHELSKKLGQDKFWCNSLSLTLAYSKNLGLWTGPKLVEKHGVFQSDALLLGSAWMLVEWIEYGNIMNPTLAPLCCVSLSLLYNVNNGTMRFLLGDCNWR